VSTAIAKVSPTSIAAGSFTDDQVSLIKRTICAGSTDDELSLFVTTAKRLGLDPFARQIFAVKRWDSRTRTEVMAIQVSIDGFRLVAERTGAYAPGSRTEYEYDDAGKLVRATAFVKKFTHGTWHETPEDAYYEEYVQTNKEGKPNAMWARMPRVMLAKCAEARALRRAFPLELGGVYIPEELDQAENARPAFRAPEGVAVIEMVEPPPTKAAADAIMSATTMAELEAASASISKLGLKKGSEARKDLGLLYKDKKAQLERLIAAQAEADEFFDATTGEVAS
jgi:phage recombination protein Bet